MFNYNNSNKFSLDFYISQAPQTKPIVPQEKVTEIKTEKVTEIKPEDRLVEDTKKIEELEKEEPKEPKEEIKEINNNFETLKNRFLNVKNKSLFIKKNKNKSFDVEPEILEYYHKDTLKEILAARKFFSSTSAVL